MNQGSLPETTLGPPWNRTGKVVAAVPIEERRSMCKTLAATEESETMASEAKARWTSGLVVATTVTMEAAAASVGSSVTCVSAAAWSRCCCECGFCRCCCCPSGRSGQFYSERFASMMPLSLLWLLPLRRLEVRRRSARASSSQSSSMERCQLKRASGWKHGKPPQGRHRAGE